MKRYCMILVCVCCSFIVRAQTKSPIKNLVFEGAGIKGIAYCGVITGLEEHNIISGIEKVGGTSSGAIVALTVSLGYSGKEIREIIGGTNFKKFNDGRYFFAGGINRTKKYFGWYRGNRFKDWLEEIITKKTGDADITFEEFHARGFKDLYVTGTCLNKQQLVVFSHETYPKMKIKDAVRISVSIPLYFEAVFIDKDGKVVKHPKQKDGLDVMVDGGITGNFPLRMFDLPLQVNYATIGFRIDSDEQIKKDTADKSLAAMPAGNLKQYMLALYNMVIENLNRQLLTKEDWQRTISISDGKVGPRIRKLSEKEVSVLIENGKKAVKTYLN